MLTRAENHSSRFPFTTLPEVIDASKINVLNFIYSRFTSHKSQVRNYVGTSSTLRPAVSVDLFWRSWRAREHVCVCKVKWRHEQAHVQMFKTIVKRNCEMLLLVLVVCRVNYYIILFCSAPSTRHTNRITTWLYMHVRLVPAMEQQRNSTSERQSN